MDVHNIGASLPAIVLCTNRHFFSSESKMILLSVRLLPIPQCRLGSIDLWKQLLTRLRQKLDKRKKRQASAKHYSHDDLEKDGPGQEREMTATLVEHTSTQLPQEHNSVSSPAVNYWPGVLLYLCVANTGEWADRDRAVTRAQT